MKVKDAMAVYFSRRLASGQPLQSADAEDSDPMLFLGPADDNGLVQWKPQPKSEVSDFSEIERRASVSLHSSIKDYYNAYWFLEFGGKYRAGSVSLDPVKPGVGLTELEDKLFGRTYGAYHVSGYITTHGGQLRHVPIGLHHGDDLLLVVDNASGEIAVEDHERGSFEVIAGGLAELIAGLD